jgi:hypothetical protein
MTAAAAITRAAAAMIVEANRAQAGAAPRPADLFGLAQAAEQALDAVYELNFTIGAQLTGLGQAGQLRPGAHRTPEQVLAAASAHGRALHEALGQARRAAGLLAAEFAGPAFLPAPTTGDVDQGPNGAHAEGPPPSPGVPDRTHRFALDRSQLR